jgi:hypothetical protein
VLNGLSFINIFSHNVQAQRNKQQLKVTIDNTSKQSKHTRVLQINISLSGKIESFDLQT